MAGDSSIADRFADPLKYKVPEYQSPQDQTPAVPNVVAEVPKPTAEEEAKAFDAARADKPKVVAENTPTAQLPKLVADGSTKPKPQGSEKAKDENPKATVKKKNGEKFSFGDFLSLCATIIPLFSSKGSSATANSIDPSTKNPSAESTTAAQNPPLIKSAT